MSVMATILLIVQYRGLSLLDKMEKELDDIIHGCLRNVRKSQHALYKLYYSYGMSIAIRYVHEENLAIEVVNDAFMKVFKYLKNYDTSQKFKYWFRKIVVHAALDHIKANKMHMTVELTEGVNEKTNEDTLSRMGYNELLALVQTLSQAYRTVFNMYVIDGYKHEEISEALGISVGTSKSNLSKARAILQQRITKHLEVSHV